ncbi:hypothetical protein Sjap_020897 [Stephania japonica]|uniref:Uncharacterized protein n=1 Tax=Stephania japonica TaxID=461633 RepID=A0AAP0F8W7_9MAGN|nr:COMT protein [Stephania japonica]
MEEELKARVQLSKHMFAFAETISLRCAVQLGLPDKIYEHGPLTLAELATKLPIKSINMDRFEQTMRYLVHMNLFTVATTDHDDHHGSTNYEEAKYELTPMSRLLISNNHNKKSLATFVMAQTDPEELFVSGRLVESLGGTKSCWELQYGVPVFEKMENDEKWSKVSDGMNGYTLSMIDAVVDGIKREGLIDQSISTLVDVGGNTGVAAKAILNAFPHLKCTVMDLLDVVENVPKDPQLNFVAGDVLSSIPTGDVLFFKSMFHGFEDDLSVKILSNCKKAMHPTKGRLIVVEMVLDIETMPEFSHARLGLAMQMMFIGGQERTKKGWERLIHKAGFTRYKIVPIAAAESIIVIYP